MQNHGPCSAGICLSNVGVVPTIRGNLIAYLVLVPSSFFFSIGAPPGWSAGAFVSPPAGGAGGGVGAGSSFLRHPANVKVKARRVTPEDKNVLFTIPNSLLIHEFPAANRLAGIEIWRVDLNELASLSVESPPGNNRARGV